MSGSGAATEPLRLRHDVGQAVTVLDGEQPVLTYHYGVGVRYPYCHPVVLPGGPALTLAQPFDHPWHLGLYFAWKYLNGLNVWEGPDGGEPYGGTRHLALAPIVDAPAGAGVRHAIAWTAADGAPLLRDERVLLVRPPDASRAAYQIDWTLRFTPLVPEVVLERKVEWGGYAGLGMRFPRSFVQPKVRNAGGQTTSAETHRARSRWTEYSGWVDGTGERTWAGAAMLDHPANPRYPTPWLTYDAPTFQFLNAAFLRDEPLVLRRGEELRLAYRVVVHWGIGDPAALDAEAAAFAATDPHAAAARLAPTL